MTAMTTVTLKARRARVLREIAEAKNERLEVDQRIRTLNFEADTIFRALETERVTS